MHNWRKSTKLETSKITMPQRLFSPPTIGIESTFGDDIKEWETLVYIVPLVQNNGKMDPLVE